VTAFELRACLLDRERVLGPELLERSLVALGEDPPSGLALATS
jgi:hypothetical protein